MSEIWLDLKGLFRAIRPGLLCCSLQDHYRAQRVLTEFESPPRYHEPREFTLPNSRLVVRHSTRYYKFVDGAENIVAPDKEITPTWKEHKSGRDPVLEWVLAAK